MSSASDDTISTSGAMVSIFNVPGVVLPLLPALSVKLLLTVTSLSSFKSGNASSSDAGCLKEIVPVQVVLPHH